MTTLGAQPGEVLELIEQGRSGGRIRSAQIALQVVLRIAEAGGPRAARKAARDERKKNNSQP